MRKGLSILYDSAAEPEGYRPTGYKALHDQQIVVLEGHGLQKIRGFKPNEGWCLCDPITDKVTCKIDSVLADSVLALPYYFMSTEGAV